MRAILLMLTACGRLGFDTVSGPIAASDATGDTAVVPPAFDAAICMQVAPFLALTGINDGGSFVSSFWCSAGIASDLTMSLIESDGITVRASTTAPITAGTTGFNPGGARCQQCVVRITAAGLTDESAPMDFSGD